MQCRARRYVKMHVRQLSVLTDSCQNSPTRDNCQQLLEYIKRHSLDTHFPMWFRMSELCNIHQLHRQYFHTFKSPVFTIDEYKILTSLLLNKGCTLPCIHHIYMYMFNPNAGENALHTTIETTINGHEKVTDAGS